jgi:hypothetical protein
MASRVDQERCCGRQLIRNEQLSDPALKVRSTDRRESYVEPKCNSCSLSNRTSGQVLVSLGNASNALKNSFSMPATVPLSMRFIKDLV